MRATALHVFAFVLGLVLSCAEKEEHDSKLQVFFSASVLVPIATYLADSVWSALNVELQDKLIGQYVGKEIEKLLGKDTSLGDESFELSEILGKELNLTLSQAANQSILENTRISLNALKDDISNYVPGLPESAVQIGLMLEKVNQIKSSLGSLISDDHNLERLGLALSTYQSYILVTAIKLRIDTERLRLAKENSEIDSDTLNQLKRILQKTAIQGRSHLSQLRTEVFKRYMERKVLTYYFEESATSLDFEFKKDIRYRYCVRAKDLQSDLCGAWSRSCATEFDLIMMEDKERACAEVARYEAKDHFERDEVSEIALTQYEKILFHSDFKEFIAYLEKIIEKASN